MTEQKRQSRVTEYLLIAALVYLVVTVLFPAKKDESSTPQNAPSVTMIAQASTFRLGTHPVLVVKNPAVRNVNQGWMPWVSYQWCKITGGDCAAQEPRSFGPTVSVASKCPEPPVGVSYAKEGASAGEARTSKDTVIPCEPVKDILPGTEEAISLAPWKYSVFQDVGTYTVRLPVTIQPEAGSGGVVKAASGTTLTATFQVAEPNAFVKLFRALVTKPLLNLLLLIGALPGHSLALAIIVLTLIVKLILFIPTQHAMEGQKKMQLLQPKLEAVRAKYPNDPQKVNEETMKLWKEHGVNPLQSCLPLLLQFPLLIGLLYVVQDGAKIALAREYIYGFNQSLPWDFNMSLFGIDLTKPEVIIFPILLIVLQFFQMKLSFVIADKKKAKEVEKAEEKPGNPMAMQQTMMQYVLPLMIGFFALRFPAAVALYWGVSTLFAIGQQVIVNKEHIRA